MFGKPTWVDGWKMDKVSRRSVMFCLCVLYVCIHASYSLAFVLLCVYASNTVCLDFRLNKVRLSTALSPDWSVTLMRYFGTQVNGVPGRSHILFVLLFDV